MYGHIRTIILKSRSFVLAAFVAISMLPSVALAVDGELGKKMGENANKEATAIIDLLKKAVTGDTDAIAQLVSQKLAPALMLVAGMFLAWTVASSIGRYFGGMVSKKVDVTLGKFLTKAVRNLLMLVVCMAVFNRFGGDITAFAALIAALGFAIGMALQGTLGNIASGVMLLLFRPFKVDDYIVVADTQGTVEEIDLFTTRINTPDNRHIIIPNSEIFGSKLENYSRNELRRVDVNVGAAYTADLEYTRAALERAIQATDCVADPASYVYLKELGASSVDWQLRAWCKCADYWAVREQMITNAKKRNGQGWNWNSVPAAGCPCWRKTSCKVCLAFLLNLQELD